MHKYSFKNDYSEGAHPRILKALMESNLQQLDGYGEDVFSKKAIETIKGRLNNENSQIYFVNGGTQANIIVLSSVLKSFEAVIAAETGHINVHEAGAIEATGHKVLTTKTQNGKLTKENILPILDFHTDEHMVKPKLVYISNTTEIGTVYNKGELESLYSFCKENELILYMDGARLGSALTSKGNDLTLADISKFTDAFYIGGTKNGALLGEAIVINNKDLVSNFRHHIKQRGALLAKGRLLGIQFLELFKDDLFYELAKNANLMAEKLSQEIGELGYHFLTPAESNQVFPILPNKLIEELNEKFDFYTWTKIDDNYSAVRLVTSWATKQELVDSFILELKNKNIK